MICCSGLFKLLRCQNSHLWKEHHFKLQIKQQMHSIGIISINKTFQRV
uniref:Uncharacterized protein n=1 Tax=Anguilla anguilla TaxID=7936 RepID=A0A0E9RKL7_ANGAN